MIRRKVVLIIVAIFLTLLHLLYFSFSKKEVISGAYFYTGLIITSDGVPHVVNGRLQSHDNKIHDFEQIDNNSQKFSYELLYSFFGSGVFLTRPMADKKILTDASIIDRDILFNYEYHSGLDSRLTLYRLRYSSKTPCFYVKELNYVLCLGAERSRDAYTF